MPDSSQDLRKKILGRQGEELTCKYLKKHRYKILERNYQTPFGEADIVAYRKGVFCFIEVKSRVSDSYGLPTEAVDERKKERYRNIARFYCSKYKRELHCRFDVSSVWEGQIEYFENAFE